ncbi:MAG: GNAT family N-acetyltransferase [Acetobacteraceae bacterium]
MREHAGIDAPPSPTREAGTVPPAERRPRQELPRFELTTWNDLAALRAMWCELEQRAVPDIFLSWDWVGCWIAEVGRDPAVLVGRAGGRIVLLALLLPYRRRDLLPFAIQGLQLHMTGDGAQDVITIEYNGFLVDAGWAGTIEADAVAYLLSGVAVEGHRRDELHLKNVPASLDACIEAAGLPRRELQRKPSWRIDLAAVRAAGGSYLDSLSANTRQQIRRSTRLYEKRGPVSAVRARSVPEALDFLDGLSELHQRYWTGRGEPGAFVYPFFVQFQRRVIETCVPRGTVELVRITAGTDVIGYVYNLIYRGHVYAYQTGIHYEDDARLKPGLMSHCLCIERHLQEGGTVYDFMAGDARYKASLGKRGPDMLYLLMQRRTWPLRLEAVLRHARQWVR